MDGLVANFTVAGVPDPMPIVVEAITGEGLERGGAGPEIVIDAGGNRFRGSVADGRAPFVANCASHVDIADGAVAEMMNGFEHTGVGARLAAVLANAVVFFYGTHELATFKGVVRAGFFDVDVFSCLASPDSHEGVPMVGSGDRDGVDVFVVEQLADIAVGFRFWQAKFLDVVKALVEYVFIHIAQSGDLSGGDMREAVDVIDAAASHTANGHAHAIVCAHNFGVTGSGDAQSSARDACTGEFKEIAPRSF